jgi:hypothetical protein
MKHVRAIVVAATVALAASCAFAQQPQTTRIRGQIEKAEGQTLTIKARDGSAMTVHLADNARVMAMEKASLADVTPGKYIGVTAMPQPDGSQKAMEVHIFAESQRGTGEGHRPFTIPNSTMTNGTVGDAVTSVDGPTLTVKYKGGEKKITVPPGVPIVRYEIGTRSELVPGAAVTILNAAKKPDGSFEAARLNVGRDGLVPR